mmetsp:Transcript_168109/g.539903  ORF Transcript_168109/g.539903 Transcript_168109/m.539903 type:complete len:283 (+) Transcript_168109:186-1034(+)
MGAVRTCVNQDIMSAQLDADAQGISLPCASNTTWWLKKTLIQSTLVPFELISQFGELSSFQARNCKPPLLSTFISNATRPFRMPFITLPCNSLVSKCNGGLWLAIWEKILSTTGMLLYIRASSMVSGYFSAANQSFNLSAVAKSTLGSKPLSVMHAFSVVRSRSWRCECPALTIMPHTMEFRGLPLGGTLKRTTSSEPVAHSAPNNMTSQSWPPKRSTKPGSSPRSRPICITSPCVTTTPTPLSRGRREADPGALPMKSSRYVRPMGITEQSSFSVMFDNLR